MSFPKNHNPVYIQRYQTLQIAASMMNLMAPSILFSTEKRDVKRSHPPGDEEFLKLHSEEGSTSTGIVVVAAIAAIAILGAAVSLAHW